MAATWLGLLVPTPAVLARTLLTCYAVTAAWHLAMISLETLLPLHVVALGGTKTQVGLLFSMMTLVSMVVRPTVGGWIDRYGALWKELYPFQFPESVFAAADEQVEKVIRLSAPICTEKEQP